MTETKQSAPLQQPHSIENGSASATAILNAADARHAELLKQCGDLMGAASGPDGEALLCHAAILFERERCAKIVAGEVVSERYRTWGYMNGVGDRSNECAETRHSDRLAEAIRAQPKP